MNISKKEIMKEFKKYIIANTVLACAMTQSEFNIQSKKSVNLLDAHGGEGYAVSFIDRSDLAPTLGFDYYTTWHAKEAFDYNVLTKEGTKLYNVILDAQDTPASKVRLWSKRHTVKKLAELAVELNIGTEYAELMLHIANSEESYEYRWKAMNSWDKLVNTKLGEK